MPIVAPAVGNLALRWSLVFVVEAAYGHLLAACALAMPEPVTPAPQLRGTGSGLMHCVFTGMTFATRTMLGVFCTRHFNLTERAAACAMLTLAIAALLLYMATAYLRDSMQNGPLASSAVGASAGEGEAQKICRRSGKYLLFG